LCFRRLTFGAQILRGTSGTADGETVKSSARPSSIQTSSGAGLQQPPSARVICLLRGGQRCALSDIGPKIRPWLHSRVASASKRLLLWRAARGCRAPRHDPRRAHLASEHACNFPGLRASTYVFSAGWPPSNNPRALQAEVVSFETGLG